MWTKGFTVSFCTDSYWSSQSCLDLCSNVLAVFWHHLGSLQPVLHIRVSASNPNLIRLPSPSQGPWLAPQGHRVESVGPTVDNNPACHTYYTGALPLPTSCAWLALSQAVLSDCQGALNQWGWRINSSAPSFPWQWGQIWSMLYVISWRSWLNWAHVIAFLPSSLFPPPSLSALESLIKYPNPMFVSKSSLSGTQAGQFHLPSSLTALLSFCPFEFADHAVFFPPWPLYRLFFLKCLCPFSVLW